MKCLVVNSGDLYLSNKLGLIGLDEEQIKEELQCPAALVCHTKYDTPVYAVALKVIQPDWIKVNLNKQSAFTYEAFYAVKVYLIKLKFVKVAQTCRDAGDVKAAETWEQIVGLMEPIFLGGYN